MSNYELDEYSDDEIAEEFYGRYLGVEDKVTLSDFSEDELMEELASRKNMIFRREWINTYLLLGDYESAFHEMTKLLPEFERYKKFYTLG